MISSSPTYFVNKSGGLGGAAPGKNKVYLDLYAVYKRCAQAIGRFGGPTALQDLSFLAPSDGFAVAWSEKDGISTYAN
jgi:hypothetical protein